MKRILGALLLAIGTLCLAVPPAPAQIFGNKKTEAVGRQVTGEVRNANDAAVSGAVVYLKNLKTLAIKTFISDQSGTYQFQDLSPNADYQVWAEMNGTKSPVKTVSSFDSRPKFTINLHLQ